MGQITLVIACERCSALLWTQTQWHSAKHQFVEDPSSARSFLHESVFLL